MNRTSRASRLKAVALALAFLLPAFAFLVQPAAAALPATGPTAQVKGEWEPVQDTHSLYLRGVNNAATPPTVVSRYLGLGQPKDDESTGTPGASTQVEGGLPAKSERRTTSDAVEFLSPPLTHDVTLLKSTPPSVTFFVDRASVDGGFDDSGDLDRQRRWRVDLDAVKEGDATARVTLVENFLIHDENATDVTGVPADGVFRSKLTANLFLAKNEYVLPEGYQFRLRISAVETQPGLGGDQPFAYTLYYESLQSPAKLDFTAKNFLYVAPWILDADGAIPTLDTLSKKATPAENRLSAWIAVKSGFAAPNVKRGGESRAPADVSVTASIRSPSGSLVDMNTSSPSHPTSVALQATSSFDDNQGWSFWQLPVFNYNHLGVGDYKLNYQVTLKRGGDNARADVTEEFSISQTAFSFGVAPGEAAGHAIFNGTTGVKSTTYLLELKNGGATADLFQLTTRWNTKAWAVSGELASQNVQISLPAQETRRLYVTVTAPSDAKVGEVASLTIAAKSTLDPTEKTVTLAATLVGAQQRGVDLIVDTPRQVLTSIKEVTYNVLVWNKGNDHDSFLLNLTPASPAGWDWSPKADVRVDNVPPGQIASVTVTVTPPATADRGDKTLRLEAEATSLGGLADVVSPTKNLDTVLRGLSAFEMKVFNPASRAMEASASATVLRGCWPGPSDTTRYGASPNKNNWWNASCGAGTDDPIPLEPQPPAIGDYTIDHRAPDWIQFRLWVTNTGTLPADYFLSIPAFAEDSEAEFPPTFHRASGRAFETVDPANERSDFGFYRAVVTNGVINYQWTSLPVSTLAGVSGYDLRGLQPGERAEIYVKVRQTESTFFEGRTLSMTVEAKDRGNASVKEDVTVSLTGVYQQKSGHSEPNFVRTRDYHAEPVRQLPGYEATHKIALDETAEKTVLPGQSVEFNYRISNLHNFVSGSWNYTTQNGEATDRSNRSLNLSIIGNLPKGWSIEMRDEAQNTTDPAKFQWKKAMDLIPPEHKTHGNRPNPYVPLATNWEHQVRIRVTAPADAKVNVDSIAPTLVIKAVENPGSPKYYYMKVDVRSEEGVNFTAPASVTVRAGTPSSYPLTIENTGVRSATVLIQPVIPANLPWSISLPQAILTIGPGDRRVVTATVDIPQTETGDGTVKFRVCAFTGQDKCGTDEKKDIAQASIRHLILDRDLASRLPMDASVLVKPIAIQNGRSEPQNFTFTIRNAYNERLKVKFDVFPNASDPTINKNFTLSVVPSTLESLQAGEQVEVQFVVQALGATSGSTYPFTVRAFAYGQNGASITGNNRPVNLLTFSVTTLEGSAVPSLETLEPVKSVDRAGFVRFPIFVKNVGSLEGEFPLEVPQSNLPSGWRATVEDENRRGVTLVKVGPGAAKTVFLNVSAPADAERAASVTASLIAYTAAKTAVGRAERSVTANVHEYAFSLTMPTEKLWIEPGGSGSVKFRVKNEGNGWDNVTFIAGIPGRDNVTWERRVELDNRPLTLKPGEEREVTVSLVPPTNERAGREWVQPGDRTVTLYGWSLDALRTQKLLNTTARGTFEVAVYNFQHEDIDGDDVEELAIDLDRNPGNGFETFREWNPVSTRTRVVESFSEAGDGRTQFILDTNRRSSADGQGDTYWNPSLGYLSNVQYVFDGGDGRPVYLFDANGPEGGEEEIDTAFFSGADAEEQIRRAKQVNVARTDGREFLLYDAEDDTLPTLYYNAGDDDSTYSDDVVTAVEAAPDERSSSLYGIRADPQKAEYTHYFDTNGETVQDATNKGVNDFLRDYWYFIAGFVLVIVVAAVVVVKRARNREE